MNINKLKIIWNKLSKLKNSKKVNSDELLEISLALDILLMEYMEEHNRE